MSEINSDELVRRVKAGDRDAFATLIEMHQDTIRSFTAIWAPSRDEADDIAQEVFLAALRSIHTFEKGRDLKLWLLGIARNLTRGAWRRVTKSAGTAGEKLDEILDRHAVSVFTERQQQADSRSEALQQCLQTLPANSKNIFVQYFGEEKSSEELAGVMKTTENTVRANLSRIRKSLRECIERRMALEGAS
jgi:RNA polymerase sigma-70 factor, ECF subfamily